MLANKNIVVGVCGGIACYKALDLVSKLKKLNASIDVIMTSAAAKFVTPLSFQSLSQNLVITDMFSETKNFEIEHISLAKKANLFVVVPASANIIGKIANGIADDMLSTTVMATKAPVLFAPAMNTNMFENPIVRSNIAKLREYGYSFIDPDVGRLACGDIGSGKLKDVDSIVDEITFMLSDKKDFKGQRVVITAGPTIEAIDPVRYITNHSSGKMGYAIAQCARNRGADVILITGPTNLSPPRNIRVINVRSNSEMFEAVKCAFDECDIIIKAAAVADYKPSQYSKEKIKKSEDTLILTLEKSIDILNELGKMKKNQILVGFAAESEDLIANAKKKIEKKNLDLIVANNITYKDSGFGSDNNIACIINRQGIVTNLPKMSKLSLADIILDNIKSIG